MNRCILAEPANQFDPALDGLARVLVVARAVACDEKSRFLRLCRARERMFLHDLTRSSQQHARHAVMRADWTAVVKRPIATLLHARKLLLLVVAQAQLAWNDLLGEIAFADEQGDDENARREHTAQHAAHVRLQFPEALEDLRKQTSPAQLVRVLISGCARLRVQRGAVSDENQGGIGKLCALHGQ
jgi:hypothetical protein